MKRIVKLTESDIRKIVDNILNEIRQDNPYHQLRDFLESRIDFEGYDIKNVNDNKFTKLYEIFVDEYSHGIERYGVKKGMIEWLQGLPSSIDIPYYRDDIINLLYALGFDEVKDMEDDIFNFYYSIVADTILENK